MQADNRKSSRGQHRRRKDRSKRSRPNLANGFYDDAHRAMLHQSPTIAQASTVIKSNVMIGGIQIDFLVNGKSFPTVPEFHEEYADGLTLFVLQAIKDQMSVGYTVVYVKPGHRAKYCRFGTAGRHTACSCSSHSSSDRPQGVPAGITPS
jgi:hypothetical protein